MGPVMGRLAKRVRLRDSGTANHPSKRNCLVGAEGRDLGSSLQCCRPVAQFLRP
jgi:hypothetical protein